MAKTLDDAIANILAKALALAGMKEAPPYPPESLNQFPIAICYPKTSDYDGQSAGWMKERHTVVCEIHFSRQLLPSAVKQAISYGRLLANAIWSDPYLGNTVDTVNRCHGTFGFLRWGDQADIHIGWSIEIDFKIETAFT